jgi:hypothetical protein
LTINYSIIGFLKKLIIFIVGISCLNNPKIGFIIIFVILIMNLFLTIFTRPHDRLIFSILKIISDLILALLILILIFVVDLYSEITSYSIE